MLVHYAHRKSSEARVFSLRSSSGKSRLLIISEKQIAPELIGAAVRKWITSIHVSKDLKAHVYELGPHTMQPMKRLEASTYTELGRAIQAIARKMAIPGRKAREIARRALQ